MTIQSAHLLPKVLFIEPSTPTSFQISSYLPIAPSTTPNEEIEHKETPKKQNPTTSASEEIYDEELIFQFDEETAKDIKDNKEKAKNKKKTFQNIITVALSSIATTEQNSPTSSPKDTTSLSDEEL